MSPFLDWLRALVMHNVALKAIALILTLALFIWVREDREAVMSGDVPVRIAVPRGRVLINQPDDRARITVRGRWSALNRFNPSDVPPITITVDEDDDDALVALTPDMVQVPVGVQVASVQPNYVRVETAPEATREVPIRARIIGQPRDSYRLGEVEVSPRSVELRGPESTVEALRFVTTEPIDVTDIHEETHKRVRLRLEDPLLQYDLDRPITVTLPIETQEVVRTIQGVPVAAINTTAQTTIAPRNVSVTVRGPKAIVDALNADSVQAWLDLSAEDNRPLGTFQKQVEIKNLPPGVQLVSFHPTDFRVTTRRAETP